MGGGERLGLEGELEVMSFDTRERKPPKWPLSRTVWSQDEKKKQTKSFIISFLFKEVISDWSR